jgi:CRISPR-associated protein Cmr2
MNEWINQVLLPILHGKMPDETKTKTLGGIALFSADIDKVKEYVFESSRLPEIRGASMILDDLNRAWPRKDYCSDDYRSPTNLREVFIQNGLPTSREKNDHEIDCIIYAGGGSLLALVPVILAETLKNEIETLYPSHTGAATISCVWQQILINENYNWNFPDMMARQNLLLRQAKEEKDPLPFFESVPLTRRCDSCQIRPAAFLQTVPDERWLCRSCRTKDMRSREHGGKKQWTREFAEELLSGSLECNVDIYLNGHEPNDRELDCIEGANDLNEIALASQDAKSIGLIYADGNDIGSVLENSKTIDDYRLKSGILHEAMRTAVFNALACDLQIERNIQRKCSDGDVKVDIHPFEIITIGGDDALLIVPGDRALDIAITLGRTFELELANHMELFNQKITLSVGLVVADCHNPFYFLRDLAEDLLKSAKKRNHERVSKAESPIEGTLDFLVLKSQTALSTDLNDLRSNFPWTIVSDTQRETAVLTFRPFTWSDLELLKYTAQAAKRRLPRTQLQALRRALREGRLSSTMFYRYQEARADDDFKMFLKWIDKKWRRGHTTCSPPWVKMEPKLGYDRYYTIWEDIWEVQDFAPKLNDEQWRELESQIQKEAEDEVSQCES